MRRTISLIIYLLLYPPFVASLLLEGVCQRFRWATVATVASVRDGENWLEIYEDEAFYYGREK